MNLNNKCVRVGIVYLALTGMAHAAVVASEDFESYTAGTVLNGGSGGTGWSGNWVADGAVTVANGVITGYGKSCQDAAFGDKGNVMYRPFPAQTGTVYLGLVFRTAGGFESSDFLQWFLTNKAAHDRSNDTQEPMGGGVRNATSNPFFARSAVLVNSSSTFHTDHTTRSVVVKLSKTGSTYDRADLFVDQPLEGTPAATATGDSGLTQLTYYHLRTYGTESGEKSLWDNIRIATTYAEAVPPGPASLPMVNNDPGASGVGTTTATLNGTLLSPGGLPAVVLAYWGAYDGGTNGTAQKWSHTNAWDAVALAGSFSTNVTGLSSDQTCYYRFAASNELGFGWAPATTNLVTSPVWVEKASDASEAGLAPGAFTVHRAGTATNEALLVTYSVTGGTAISGSDFAALSGAVVIPAGETTAAITVTPLPDALPAEGSETVQVTLQSGPYPIGTPSSASLEIADNTSVGYCYVSPDSANEGAPYNTWDTAAHDLQTAVDYCSANLTLFDKVVVTNGVHAVSAPVRLASGVSVMGLGGASNVTVFRNGATNYPVFVLSHAGAMLDGLTITNGGVSGVSMSAGTVRNCTVRNNTDGGLSMSGGVLEDSDVAYNSGRWGVGVDIESSATAVLVRRCRIYGNASAEWAGGVWIQGVGVVEDSVISNNNHRAVFMSGAGTVRNCLIANNTYDGSTGGGVYMQNAAARIENCTIVGNKTTQSGGSGAGLRIATAGGIAENCIVYHNETVPGDPDLANLHKSGGTFAFSCTPSPLPTGPDDTDNIADDPQFVSLAQSDYQLGASSPCRDSGKTLPSVANDLLGVSRPQGAAYDMGAYEGSPPPGTILLIL